MLKISELESMTIESILANKKSQGAEVQLVMLSIPGHYNEYLLRVNSDEGLTQRSYGNLPGAVQAYNNY